MKTFSLYITLFLLSSCSGQNVKKETIDKDKMYWILAFKSDAFTSCLKNSGVEVNNDASPSLNFELLGDIKVIKEAERLGKAFSDTIAKRAVWLTNEDFKNDKTIVNGCLSFYTSRELDLIAEAAYNKFVKGN